MSAMITIEQHLSHIKCESKIKDNIANILYDISLASKLIRKHVLVAGFESSVESGTINTHGESVKTLDLVANTALKDVLSAHGRFTYIGSEEEDEILTIESAKKPSYSIYFDPLDGSSNIDVNISVGTIFSVYEAAEGSNELLPGRKQVAAGYVIYGSSVMLVYTSGSGVYGFTYDPTIGEFLLSHNKIQIPNSAKYYSINESLYPSLNSQLQETLDDFKTKKYGKLSSRYVGSLVADFHRNLIKGGVFAYPATPSSPKGKLRLMYEANPLAFICEQAGGYASNGTQNILDVEPDNIHDKTPLYIGSSNLVDALCK